MKVFKTSHVENGYPVLLQVWHPSTPDGCSARLDCYNQFSIPFKGRNKHPELTKSIIIVEDITDTEEACELLKW